MPAEPEQPQPTRASHSVRRVASNAAGTYGFRAAQALSVLLLTPVLFRQLGVAGFGTWSVVATVASMFELIETGFLVGAVKFVSEQRATGDERAVRETVGATVVSMTLLGLLAFAVSVLIAVFGAGMAPESEREAFQAGMLVVGASMVFRFPAVSYSGVLMGLQRYDVVYGLRSVSTLAFTAVAVIAVLLGYGVFAVCAAYALFQLFDGVVAMLVLRRVDRPSLVGPRHATTHAGRRLMRFSSLATLADSMVFIGQRMDTVVIAAIRDAAAAAPFAAAVKLQTGVQSLTLPFVQLMIPMTSDLWVRGEQGEVGRRFVLATRVVLQITLPVAVGLALFSQDFVDLWLGPSAPASTAAIIVVLLAVQIITLTTVPAEKIMVGIGRVRTLARLAMLDGVANLLVSIVLVTQYGAIGAAIGTLLTTAVIAPVRLPLVCRELGWPTPSTVASAVGPAVVRSLPALAAMVAVWLLMPVGTLRLIAGMGIGMALAIGMGVHEVGRERALALGRSIRTAAG